MLIRKYASWNDTFHQHTLLSCQLSYFYNFNVQTFYYDVINFLGILWSWPQNKYDHSLRWEKKEKKQQLILHFFN